MSFRNPTFTFRVGEPTKVLIKFERVDKKKTTGMVVFLCVGANLKRVGLSNVFVRSEFEVTKRHFLDIDLEPRKEEYHIVPCLQRKIGGARYRMEVRSEKKLEAV